MTSSQSELEIRLRQQALLAELGRRALTNITFDGLLEEATHLCAIGMGVRYCKVLEYLPEEGRLLVHAGVGWHEGVVGHQTLGADLGSPAGYALHTGKAVISNNLATDTRFRTPDILVQHDVRRALNVILLGNGTAWGVLEVDSEVMDVEFSEHDVDFLQAVSNLLGLALERRKAEEALKTLNENLEQRVEQELAARLHVEDVLRQTQKMEAIGHLTGGVAHDFNNFLQIITGNLDRVARRVSGDPELEAPIANAQKAAERGAQLTSQLLTFARRQTLRPEARPINELIRELDVLVGRMLGVAIGVECLLDPDAGVCLVDTTLFGSALINLLVNAHDAMPDGGQITIRSGNMVLDEPAAARHADARAIGYVYTEVTDTGHGMPEEVLRRAIEPFFTTKSPGKGTGLGLAQIYGFARQSGGFLTIFSKPGSGTTIRIHLPRVLSHVDTVIQSDIPNLNGGTETILVVEDDRDILELTAAQLEELGYSTVRATSGHEALAVLTSDVGMKVDLLMTDVAMPGGMTGYDLVREARLRHPGLRAMLVSGYVTSVLKDEAPDIAILTKPFRLPDLERVVRDTLAAG